MDFNPNLKSHKLRMFTNETQTQEEGNDLLFYVFRMLARRLIRYLERARNGFITLFFLKKPLSPNWKSALFKNKPSDNWIGVFNLISDITLIDKAI